MNGVTLLGPTLPSGVYVLWIAIHTQTDVRFGRFADGRPITLAPAPYLYIGSAMASRGASTLAHRLLRHATRGSGAAHRVRPELCTVPVVSQLRPPTRKRLHWHIDYLLDQPTADLTGIVAIRSARPLEAALARTLTQESWTAPVAPGLGAGDHPGASHLLRITGDSSRCEDALLMIARQLTTARTT